MTNMSTLAATSEPGGDELASLQESYRQLAAELQLMREDAGWLLLSGQVDQFGKAEIDDIAALARLFVIKNPLIKRGIEVKQHYVFGQGYSLSAPEAAINAVIQRFIDDRRNREVLFAQQSLLELEKQAQTDGNLFFALFTSQTTGRVRVRDIEATEIVRVIRNPEDSQEVWFYERRWQAEALDGVRTGRRELYPDWRYAPPQQPRSLAIAGVQLRVNWDAPIYHARRGGFPNWAFGLSELYAGLDWARAYKGFLEDWATITKALARFAFKAKTPAGAGARGVAAAKARLNSTLTNSDSERNPPPPAGSIWVGREGYDLEPVKTAGAQASMDDGRRLLLMVAATVGLPETFFGDASVGSLATARSLDRPTELMMRSIQSWWAQLLSDICGYAVLQAVKAPAGALRGLGAIERDDDDNLEMVRWGADPETGEDLTGTIAVTFPPIVEIDPKADVEAVMQAAPAIPDERLVASKLLTILGFDAVDELLDRMFTEDEAQAQADLDAQVAEALREVRAALQESRHA